METALGEVSAPQESFQDQFKRKEKLGSLAGEVEFVDLTPPEVTDQTPVLLVEGWGETVETHKESLRTIFNSRRRGIAVNFPRHGGARLVGSAPEVEMRKAGALQAAIYKAVSSQVDVIAHSEGALSTIVTASTHPDKIRNVVFVDPAGLIGKDSTFKLGARFVQMLSKDAFRLVKGTGSRKEMIKAANEAGKYFASNPVRGLKEVSAISAADIYETLENLRKIGIGVSVIHGVDDTLFPMKRVLNTTGEKGGMDTVGFYSVKGDHREISVHPEKYTALAVNALENLANKQSPS